MKISKGKKTNRSIYNFTRVTFHSEDAQKPLKFSILSQNQFHTLKEQHFILLKGWTSLCLIWMHIFPQKRTPEAAKMVEQRSIEERNKCGKTHERIRRKTTRQSLRLEDKVYLVVINNINHRSQLKFNKIRLSSRKPKRKRKCHMFRTKNIVKMQPIPREK